MTTLARNGVKYIHSFDVALRQRPQGAVSHPNIGGNFGGWIEDYQLPKGVQSPDEPTTPFDPSFLFRCCIFTISAIANFDDAARREATANANQTRVDERKSSYSQYLRVRVVV